MKDIYYAMAADFAVGDEAAETIEVRCDCGGCADFLSGELGVLIDVFARRHLPRVGDRGGGAR